MSKILKLPLESIKVGTFVRWAGQRMFADWDCICIITDVDHSNEKFSVMTFDDFDTVTNLSFYTADKTEFSVSSAKEVKKYLLETILKHKIELAKLEEKKSLLELDMEEINEFIRTNFNDKFYKGL